MPGSYAKAAGGVQKGAFARLLSPKGEEAREEGVERETEPSYYTPV